MLFLTFNCRTIMNDWEGRSTDSCNIDRLGTYTIERSYSITTNVRPSVCMSVCPYFCLSGLGENVIFSASN